MMREILFRGKRIDNGEWMEGYYMPRPNTVGGERHYIVRRGSRVWFEIDVSTLCQYTGLTDKNGKKIWKMILQKEIIRSHMEDDGWIPVEKMLPNKPIPVWVTNKIGTHCCVSVDTYHNGEWQYYDDGRIIAWKWKDNYPAPYRPKEEN